MQSPSNEPDSPGSTAQPPPPPEPEQSYYPPRVCRICLDTVLPTVQPSEFLQRPRVVYESTDPELGRLLRPCKCKGSSRYVHEGCLQTWRHADPRYGRRNYWQCPTCGFQYRLERLTWARWISSSGTQILLTIGILLLTMFLLGFVADPIIKFFLVELDDLPLEVEDLDTAQASWVAHFIKGLASLGLLSFFRVMFMMSPWNLRVATGGGRSSSRDRMRWLMIVIGVGTFLWAVYKGVRSWSKRTLERAGERVMDVPLPDDEDDDAAMPQPQTSDPDHPKTD
ncbi:uncharacterized protein N7473_000209 [Penicillium subrubescens]|uniref:RING-CH-type domain-containing protein n=1 Tax=Penicillium subrubescens TaxID=1316194 RepID=A0A1Q5SNM3_9EURO|nr:uncharacterized protein N7473_000209 [Penicillium subrubescens]KAJ5910906.1 hypothetical protein N7473_000209 [Penicillium subrubescens]OKO89609.1 hypothetical protein PENSUB_13675 [Penicillium subrubescens]